MTRTIIGQVPPSLFFKMRQQRADAVEREQRRLHDEALTALGGARPQGGFFEALARRGVQVVPVVVGQQENEDGDADALGAVPSKKATH